MKTRTIVTTAPDEDAGNSVSMVFENINNPSFLEKFKYATDDSTNPEIIMTSYSGYKKATEVNMELPLRTSYTPVAS